MAGAFFGANRFRSARAKPNVRARARTQRGAAMDATARMPNNIKKAGASPKQ